MVTALFATLFCREIRIVPSICNRNSRRGVYPGPTATLSSFCRKRNELQIARARNATDVVSTIDIGWLESLRVRLNWLIRSASSVIGKASA